MDAVGSAHPIVVIGAGGFGREVLDIIIDVNRRGGQLDLVGVADDGDPDLDLLQRRGVQFLGSTSDIDLVGTHVAIGIGVGATRELLDVRLDRPGPATLVHGQCSIGEDNRLGPGLIACAGARVTTNITVGRHVNLHVNCTIGHDSSLGDYVSVYPGATVSGDVTIGVRSTIGTGANILPGVRIGADAMIGAGAVVVRDVAAGTTVAGVPATVMPDGPTR